ncbi:MAG: TolC family protein, partial [bacterium]|nr:TolC family protein [bacterium]
GTSSSTLSDLVNLDLMVWNLVGNMTQPLFAGGRLKATVRKNEALSREAAANYESALLRAYSEVESSLAAENVLARQEEALTEATRQSLAARRLSEERYRLGLTDIITLLQSQRTALDSESALLNVRRLRLENRVNLHLGLGGGFAQQPKSQQSKQGGRS